MKTIKIFIIIGIGALVCACAAALYVWYTVQKIDRSYQGLEVSHEVKKEIPTTLPEPSQASENTPESNETSAPAPSTETTVSETIPEEAIQVDVTDMSDSQRKILEAFGHTDSTFTITPEMVVCAKNAVSEVRYAEILNGAAPTPLESLKLLPCFAADGG